MFWNILISSAILAFIVVATIKLWARAERINQRMLRLDGEVLAWATSALENKFWRMLAGKELIDANNPLGRFVLDLQTHAKPILLAENTPMAKLTEEWFVNRSGVLSAFLRFECERRSALNTTSPNDYDWWRVKAHIDVVNFYEFSNSYELRLGYLPTIMVDGKEYRGRGYTLAIPFVRKLYAFYTRGLSAVIVKPGAYPAEAIAALTAAGKKLPEQFMLWQSSNKGSEVATDLELARVTIDGLRMYDDDPMVKRLIDRYETIIHEVEAKTAITQGASDVILEANRVLLEIEKSSAVRSSMDRMCALVEGYSAETAAKEELARELRSQG